MTWHPTTNRVQTDLLTREQREALEVWQHGVESYAGGGKWKYCRTPRWYSDSVYRGKPAPVVASVWFNRHNDGMSGPYRTRQWADQCATHGRIDVLRIDTCNGVSTAHLEGLKDE